MSIQKFKETIYAIIGIYIKGCARLIYINNDHKLSYEVILLVHILKIITSNRSKYYPMLKRKIL